MPISSTSARLCAEPASAIGAICRHGRHCDSSPRQRSVHGVGLCRQLGLHTGCCGRRQLHCRRVESGAGGSSSCRGAWRSACRQTKQMLPGTGPKPGASQWSAAARLDSFYLVHCLCPIAIRFNRQHQLVFKGTHP